MADDLLIRPMLQPDVAIAQEISREAFYRLDQIVTPRGWPEPTPRGDSAVSAWHAKTGHVLKTDPGGCWVAEQDGALLGFVTSLRREGLWILASYGVLPHGQGQGVGRQLLEAALEYSVGCLRGMFCASPDPKALRRYHAAGFTFAPFLTLRGVPDRTGIPLASRVRAGSESDLDLCDSVDRRTRGAAHGADHRLFAQQQRLLVVDGSGGGRGGQGYAWVSGSGVATVLAATDRQTARSLLWEALATAEPGTSISVPHISPANQWAVDVAMQARLEVHQRGYLALRGMKEPTWYIPHSTLL